MDVLSEENIKLLKKDFPAFKKKFSEDTQRAYKVRDFKLTTLSLGKQKDGFLEVNFEYKGECSLTPGDCRYMEMIKISELKSPTDFFQQLDRIISQRVHDSFRWVS